MTRVALIEPPLHEPRAPYLALPALTASLQAHGHEVRQWDFNVESFARFLSRDYLESCRSKVAATLTGAMPPAARRVRTSALRRAPYVLRHIERARKLLRRPAGGRAPAFPRATNVMRAWALVVARSALDLVSARYYPTRVSFGELALPYRIGSSRELLHAVHDQAVNPYRELFAADLLPVVLAAEPQIVGISINDRPQVIPGLTAAALARGQGRLVIVGGAMFSKEMKVSPRLFEVCDGFVVGDGTPALLDLCEHVDGALELGRVRNLLWCRDGVVVENSLGHEVPPDEEPTPVFARRQYFLFFEDALTLPLRAGRGCYWGRCSFCNIAFGERYAPRAVDVVLRDVEQHLQDQGVRSFFLTNESLAPAFLREFAEELLRRRIAIEWQGYARLEETFDEELCALLAAAGCTMLLVGLESGCQRILDLHNKGTDVGIVKRVLHNLARAGIGIHLFVLLGTPTETAREAMETLELLRQHAPLLDGNRCSFTFGTMFLSPHSRLAASPEAFGIDRLVIAERENDLDTQEKHLFASEGGLTRDQAQALAEAWYREFGDTLRHYGVHRILWGPELDVPSVALRFADLLQRLLRHTLRTRPAGPAR